MKNKCSSCVLEQYCKEHQILPRPGRVVRDRHGRLVQQGFCAFWCPRREEEVKK